MKYLIILVLVLCKVSFAGENEWSSETELSVLQAGGNTVTETYNLKTQSKLKINKRSYSVGGHYTFGSSNVTDPASGETQEDVVENARNWDVYAKFEQELSKRFSGFTSVKFEGDEFAGYKQRENYDLGTKYDLIKTDTTKSFLEFGYRYTIERTLVRNENGDDVLNDNKARTYYEHGHKVKSGLSYKFWVEYIYNFNRTEDYLINAEPSISVAIDETFKLKVAYKAMYDNDPAIEGNKYLDWQYTTALLATY